MEMEMQKEEYRKTICNTVFHFGKSEVDFCYGTSTLTKSLRYYGAIADKNR